MVSSLFSLDVPFKAHSKPLGSASKASQLVRFAEGWPGAWFSGSVNLADPHPEDILRFRVYMLNDVDTIHFR